MKIKLTMTRESIYYESFKTSFLDKYSKHGFSLKGLKVIDPPIFEADILKLIKEIGCECIVEHLENDCWYVEIYNDHRE